MTPRQRERLIELTGVPAGLWINSFGLPAVHWTTPENAPIPLVVGDAALLEHARSWAEARHCTVARDDYGWMVYRLSYSQRAWRGYADRTDALICACELATELKEQAHG